MAVFSGAAVVGNRIPKSPYPQNSGKGQVIGEIFSSATQATLDKVRSAVSPFTGGHTQSNMDINGNKNTPGPGPDWAPGPSGSDGDNDLEYKLTDLFNDTTNISMEFDVTTGLTLDYTTFLDCDTGSDSMCVSFSNLTNATLNTADDMPEPNYWVLFLLLLPLCTVFGNVLVVLSVYRERSLRHVTNYFICSLAVADILVAIVVMPPGVFYEATQYWSLSDELCDAWVAFDVMACTASILNLTAISVDRFIAVTQPIKYAKHKNSKRVQVMLALTWVVSIAISAPIALGVNYTPARTVGSCSFYNSDFLIYSSMGSFYTPSLIMIFLYWRIYRALRIRARKSLANKKARSIDTQTLTNVIENTGAGSEPTIKTSLAKMDNGKVSTYNTNTNNCHTSVPHETHIDEASISNPPTDSQEKDEDDESDTKSPVHEPDTFKGGVHGELIVNPVAEDIERREQLANKVKQQQSIVSNTNEMETQFGVKNNTNDVHQEEDSSGKQSSDSRERRKKEKKNVTKFNFHMRTSRKRKERSSSRRERKATKTLAIVLGVFLLCWWPFFTINIMRAICLRYEVLNYPKCDIDQILNAFFVWLGYINSFLNPVIYTIFNPEFRKAFKKILTEPCKHRYN